MTCPEEAAGSRNLNTLEIICSHNSISADCTCSFVHAQSVCAQSLIFFFMFMYFFWEGFLGTSQVIEYYYSKPHADVCYGYHISEHCFKASCCYLDSFSSHLCDKHVSERQYWALTFSKY